LDENFTKYIKMYKLKIPIVNVKQKMKNEGVDPDLIDLFIPEKEIAEYKKIYG